MLTSVRKLGSLTGKTQEDVAEEARLTYRHSNR